jgi:hypothetical protein
MGTGGSGSGTGGSTVACDAPTMIFKPTCGVVGCHSPGGSPPDLVTAPVENSLIGKPQVLSTLGSCNMNLVNSTKPAAGALFQRLNGMDCGASMPFLGAMLPADQLQCITDWVNSKLPN